MPPRHLKQDRRRWPGRPQLGAFAFAGPDDHAGRTRRALEAHPQRLLQRHAARHAQPLRAAARRPAPAPSSACRSRSACTTIVGSVDEAVAELQLRMQEPSPGRGRVEAADGFIFYPNSSIVADEQTGPLAGDDARSAKNGRSTASFMAVYVDAAIWRWAGHRWCHLLADDTDDASLRRPHLPSSARPIRDHRRHRRRTMT